MPTPAEHKTVQNFAYLEAIGWMFVSREEVEQQHGFEPQMTQMSADPGGRKNLSPPICRLTSDREGRVV